MKMPENMTKLAAILAKEQGIGAPCVCNGTFAADIMAVRLQKQ